MSTIVYRISVLLGTIVADVPVGTNPGLFWLLWALLSGRFLLSRGAVFPALADGGFPAAAVRRSGAALAYGRWAMPARVRVWHQVVQQEGRWHAQRWRELPPPAGEGAVGGQHRGVCGRHDSGGGHGLWGAVLPSDMGALASRATARGLC